MQPQNVWTEETRVKGFETDFRQRWKPACFFQYMQVAAGHHASNLGFDYREMFARGISWVLTRMKIRFLEFPHLPDAVAIRTWPRGVQQKLFFTRDFQFLKPDGGLYAVATSAWLLMDIHARRMVRPDALPGKLPDNQGLFALDEPLEKIAPGLLEEKFTLEAGYSAVDLMGHVNNARYIDWACDCFSLQTHQEKQLEWLQINYSNEIKPGECVVISAGAGEQPGLWYIQGNHVSGGLRAFDAAWKWAE